MVARNATIPSQPAQAAYQYRAHVRMQVRKAEDDGCGHNPGRSPPAQP
jgi:hypothetical protein